MTEVARDNGANAVYKGLAIAQASDGKTYLYATNFRSGRVEAYDSTFTPVQLPQPWAAAGSPGHRRYRLGLGTRHLVLGFTPT